MRYFLYYKNANLIEITNWVLQGVAISDNGDGTYDNAALSIEAGIDDIAGLDLSKCILPKSKVLFLNDPNLVVDDINSVVWDYVFIVSKDSFDLIRYPDIDAYKHDLELVELTAELEGKKLPNLTITQNNSQYYNNTSIVRRLAVNSIIDPVERVPNSNDDGTIQAYNSGFSVINTENITQDSVAYGSDASSIFYTTFKDIDSTVYEVNIKTLSQSRFPCLRNGNSAIDDFNELNGYFPVVSNNAVNWSQYIQFDETGTFRVAYKVKIYALDSDGNPLYLLTGDQAIITKVVQDTAYIVESGGQRPIWQDGYGWYVNGYSTAQTTGISIGISKNLFYPYILLALLNPNNIKQIKVVVDTLYVPNRAFAYAPQLQTIYVGTNGRTLNGFINTLQISTTSNPISNVSVIDSAIKTPLDLVNKALYEVNKYERTPYTLSPRAEYFLSNFSLPELQLEGYTLALLLKKLFKIGGGIPVLGHNGDLYTIDALVPDDNTTNSPLLSKHVGKTGSIDGEDFNAITTANATNIQNDLESAYEESIINSTSLDFAQTTQDNLGFLFTHNIKHLEKAILLFDSGIGNGSEITISIGDGTNSATYNGNIDGASGWDISSRVFEQEEYNALPDVDFSTIAGRSQNVYGKGNSIYYISGSKAIYGLGHQAPSVPTYNFFAGSQTGIGNLAIAELLCCLACEKFVSTYGTTITSITINNNPSNFQTVLCYKLQAVYKQVENLNLRLLAPQIDKYYGNAEETKNVSDRTSSVIDTANIMEQENLMRGNDILTISMEYATYDEVLETGVRLPGDYIVTGRQLVLYKNAVKVDYTLHKNFFVLSDEYALDEEYRRYVIPLTYSVREALCKRYFKLSYSPFNANDLDSDNIANINAIWGLFISGIDDNIQEIYNLINVYLDANNPDNIGLQLALKVRKYVYKNSITFISSTIDNYNAGQQIFDTTQTVGSTTAYYRYSLPYKYTNTDGSLYKISANVGYNIQNYTPKLYPAIQQNTSLSNVICVDNDLFRNKDARESLQLNFTLFLSSFDGDNIKVFNNFTQPQVGLASGSTFNSVFGSNFYEQLPLGYGVNFTFNTNGSLSIQLYNINGIDLSDFNGMPNLVIYNGLGEMIIFKDFFTSINLKNNWTLTVYWSFSKFII